MKLSIITVNLNNRDGLKKTIDSVISQTFRDFEWIVIDGGSTDGSKELIEEYSSHFSYWCSEPDKGIYNAMNKGVAFAKGEYCQFLNSGDAFHDDLTLENVFAKNSTADIIYGDICFVSKSSKEEYKYPEAIDINFLIESSIAHPSSFIKLSCFSGFSYPETYKIVSDWIGWLIFYLRGFTFGHIDTIVSDFSLGGISDTNTPLMNEERRRALDEFLPTGIRDLYERVKYYEGDNHVKKTLTVLRKGRFHSFILKIVLCILDRI